MRNATIAYAGVVAFMVLAVSATVAYFPPGPNASLTTRTQQSTSQSGSDSGLVLGASLNASVVSPGEVVSLRIWELNSLDHQNNVTAETNWPYAGLALGPCGTLSLPFGFKVLAGYYSKSSPGISTVQGVQLYSLLPYFCPAIFKVGFYNFYPDSEEAVMGGFCSQADCFTNTLNSTSYISGEYVHGVGMTPLPSGVYTVVVGNEWGASVLMYFSVSSNGLLGTTILTGGTSFQVPSSYDCVAGNYQAQFVADAASVLSGGFTASPPGATLYVATVQQASGLVQGHPAQWVYSTGLQNSSMVRISLPEGSYVLWFEGADLNCGARIVMPLELLTRVNITQSFTLTPG
jgi:hypothetical protein